MTITHAVLRVSPPGYTLHMVEIPLNDGLVALLDDEDAHLTAHAWFARQTPWGPYVQRKAADGTTLYLHREVLRAPPGVEVDHRDGNRLDCRRHNLRLATTAQNAMNRRCRNRYGFKGVRRKRGRWEATFRGEYLGRFDVVEDAARAYDVRARAVYGEFARLNFP